MFYKSDFLFIFK